MFDLAPILWKLDFPGEQLDPIKARGEQIYWNNASRYLWLRQGLVESVSRLAKKGISCVVLKGMHLAVELYNNPGYRTVGDIDLLVAREDIPEALAILAEMGLKTRDKKDDKIFEVFGENTEWSLGEFILKTDGDLYLDLHWHLLPIVWLRPFYKIKMDDFWQDLRPIHMGEYSGAYQLSPTHNLIYLCVHLGLHGLGSIRRLLDIDLFVRKLGSDPEWDWAKFVDWCVKWEVKSITYHVLCFAVELFGTPVPQPVLAQLNPGIFARLRVNLLIRPKNLIVRWGRAIGLRFPVLVKAVLMDRSSDLVSLAFRTIYPSVEWRLWRYNGNRSIFYHWKHIIAVVLRNPFF